MDILTTGSDRQRRRRALAKTQDFRVAGLCSAWPAPSSMARDQDPHLLPRVASGIRLYKMGRAGD